MSTVLPSAKEYADENASTDGGRRFAPAATILLKVELVDGASDEDDGDAILPDEGFDCITLPFRNVFEFGGSFHCVTTDIRRRGHMKSYFKALDAAEAPNSQKSLI